MTRQYIRGIPMPQLFSSSAKDAHEWLERELRYQLSLTTPLYTSRRIHEKIGRNEVLGLPHPYMTSGLYKCVHVSQPRIHRSLIGSASYTIQDISCLAIVQPLTSSWFNSHQVGQVLYFCSISCFLVDKRVLHARGTRNPSSSRLLLSKQAKHGLRDN